MYMYYTIPTRKTKTSAAYIGQMFSKKAVIRLGIWFKMFIPFKSMRTSAAGTGVSSISMIAHEHTLKATCTQIIVITY